MSVLAPLSRSFYPCYCASVPVLLFMHLSLSIYVLLSLLVPISLFQSVLHFSCSSAFVPAPSVHLQFGALYGVRAKRGSLRVDICHVAIQEGSNDCGLFAIAYATELAHGGDPAKVVYSQGEMRSHFIKCLENGIPTPFPRELELVRTERPTTLTYPSLSISLGPCP